MSVGITFHPVAESAKRFILDMRCRVDGLGSVLWDDVRGDGELRLLRARVNVMPTPGSFLDTFTVILHRGEDGTLVTLAPEQEQLYAFVTRMTLKVRYTTGESQNLTPGAPVTLEHLGYLTLFLECLAEALLVAYHETPMGYLGRVGANLAKIVDDAQSVVDLGGVPKIGQDGVELALRQRYARGKYPSRIVQEG